mgnify:CR=1 FL=1
MISYFSKKKRGLDKNIFKLLFFDYLNTLCKALGILTLHKKVQREIC